MVDSAEGAERAVAFPAAEVGPGVGVVGEVVVGGGSGGHFGGLVGFFFWFVFVFCRVLFGVFEEFRCYSSSSSSSFSLQRYSCPHMQHHQSR